MQVMFIRLDLDLENTSLDVVHMTHKACLAIQVRTLYLLLLVLQVLRLLALLGAITCFTSAKRRR
jgi:hypothetical protein